MARSLRNTKGQFITGVKEVVNAIDGRSKKVVAALRTVVTVGYEAPYAIYVHENPIPRHEPGKSYKYLSSPSKVFRPQMQHIVRQALKRGMAPDKAQLLAARFLLRMSQKIVPVSGWDPIISPKLPTSGTLKKSGFIDVDNRR